MCRIGAMRLLLHPTSTRSLLGNRGEQLGDFLMRSWFCIALILAAPAFAQRPAIRSAADLPPTRFALDAPPSQAFAGQAFLTRTLPLLKAEAERLRAGYDIQDQALAQELRDGLAAIAVLQKRPGDAQALIAEGRAATTKLQLKAIGSLTLDVAASIVDGPPATGCERGAQRIDALLAQSAPTVVRDQVLQYRTSIEVFSDAFAAGMSKAEMDPGAASNGNRIDLRTGLRLAAWQAELANVTPCRAVLSAAIQRWAAAPSHQPADIWAAREPTAQALVTAQPVVVAVWDSGVDPTIFPDQLAIDPSEPIDGRDNDGNGIVDDWNGPTYDAHMRPDASPLKRASSELASQLGFQMALYKGTTDMMSGLDTAEGRLFAQRGREAGLAEQEMDALLWDEVRARSHGTGVASEIADGNAFVRLYSVSALPWGTDLRPVVVDEAMNDRWVAAVDRLAARFHAAGVRVVNMSWGYTVDEIADGFMRYGGVSDQAQATARAKAMWAKADAAMRRLLAACPDILFVNAAGNSNQTDEILASTPQSTAADNLLVVGATGRSGLPTSFTTYGKGVGIYALGQGVPLRVPGGMMMRMSGTSMAAPLVARAAAQMLAVNPRLTVRQMIAGLTETATPEGGLKLLDAAHAVAWARQQ